MKRPWERLTVPATIFSLCALWLSAVPVAAQTTYYVSQSSGSDDYDGQAAAWDGKHGPWQTLTKASSVAYQPGHTLLLKCGDVWDETLTLRGDGGEGSPITVAAYGTGQRPFIRRSPGNRTACVIIDNASGYCLRDLELGYAQNAIRLAANSHIRTELGDYLIENCFLHDTANPIFPDAAKNEGRAHNDYRNMGWAIFADGFESPAPVHLKNLTVRNCCGLRTQGFFMPMGPVALENVLFEGNTVSHSSFNSVYQIGAKGFDIIDSVFVYGYPWEFHPNGTTQVLAGGITGDATVRNEVRNNEFGWAGDYPGRPDGCAYDFEGSTGSVTFQNNFVHDTFGEAVLFMPRCQHDNLIFDKNIFRNNVRFSSTWNVEVTLFPDNTGNGTLSNNVFFPRPGKRAINSKPACFTFIDNDENATGTFVEMPLVTNLVCQDGARTYTLACKTAGATIRYTLDGSLPTSSATQYTGPVTVDRSGALNCKAFKDGCYASSVNSVGVDLRDAEGADPVAWWKLDEVSGTTTTDSTGGGTSSLSGCTWTGGKINNGLQFNGVEDAVALRSARLQTISDTFTISFWTCPRAPLTLIKEGNSGVAGTSGQRFALLPQHGGDNGDVGTGVSVGTNGISVYEHATDYLPSLLVDDCPLSGWNHIAVVYRNKQPTLYLNGVYEKAGCKSTKTVHPLFDLGGSDYGWYDGTLDEVRVYDRALTDAEIQVLSQ
ncbi:MAG: LamG-like jellyroll fold domain-containing protein [Pirellulaceae bacterium]